MIDHEEQWYVRIFDPKGPDKVGGKRFRAVLMTSRQLLSFTRRNLNCDAVSMIDGAIVRKAHKSPLPSGLFDDLQRAMYLATGRFQEERSDPDYQI